MDGGASPPSTPRAQGGKKKNKIKKLTAWVYAAARFEAAPSAEKGWGLVWVKRPISAAREVPCA